MVLSTQHSLAPPPLPCIGDHLALHDNLMDALIRTDTVAPVLVALPTLGVGVSD